jgi:hypothetical protein
MPRHWKRLKSSVSTLKKILLDSKVEPFQYPRNMAEARMKVSKNSVPDPIALQTQKIDQMNTQFVRGVESSYGTI